MVSCGTFVGGSQNATYNNKLLRWAGDLQQVPEQSIM